MKDAHAAAAALASRDRRGGLRARARRPRRELQGLPRQVPPPEAVTPDPAKRGSPGRDPLPVAQEPPEGPMKARRLAKPLAALVPSRWRSPRPFCSSPVPTRSPRRRSRPTRPTSATARCSTTRAAASRATRRPRGARGRPRPPLRRHSVPDPDRRLLPAEPDAGRGDRPRPLERGRLRERDAARPLAARHATTSRRSRTRPIARCDGGPARPARLPDEPARGDLAVAGGRGAVVALARRGVGLWKRIAFRQPPFSPEPGRTPPGRGAPTSRTRPATAASATRRRTG